MLPSSGYKTKYLVAEMSVETLKIMRQFQNFQIYIKLLRCAGFFFIKQLVMHGWMKHYSLLNLNSFNV